MEQEGEELLQFPHKGTLKPELVTNFFSERKELLL